MLVLGIAHISRVLTSMNDVMSGLKSTRAAVMEWPAGGEAACGLQHAACRMLMRLTVVVVWWLLCAYWAHLAGRPGGGAATGSMMYMRA